VVHGGRVDALAIAGCAKVANIKRTGFRSGGMRRGGGTTGSRCGNANSGTLQELSSQCVHDALAW
jgi:hypothetical protein